MNKLKFCPFCGVEQKIIGAKFCWQCGVSFCEEEAVVCQHCMIKLAAGVSFCPYCGGNTTPISQVKIRFCKLCGNQLNFSFPIGSFLCSVCSSKSIIPKNNKCPQCGRKTEEGNLCDRCKKIEEFKKGFYFSKEEYEHPEDKKALEALHKIKVIQVLASQISKRLGKPWIESQLTGIKISEQQFPDVYKLAQKAARLVCLPVLPDIYIGGESYWEANTYGTEDDSFVVLSPMMIRIFSPLELLFVLAHELAHVRSGHALYKTVAEIISGKARPGQGLTSRGILGILNIQKLITMSVELPLLAWSRLSEISADKAALIAVGDLEIARKVLLIIALRSKDVYNKINISAYLKQQEELDSKITKLSEFLSQSSPYIATRIKFITEFYNTDQFKQIQERLLKDPQTKKLKETLIKTTTTIDEESKKTASSIEERIISGKCPYCKKEFKIKCKKLLPKIKISCKFCQKVFGMDLTKKKIVLLK